MLYNIDDDTYNKIWEDGGIVLSFAFNVQHVFTNRWITYLTDTNIFDINRYLQEEAAND